MISLKISKEVWALKESFNISRVSMTQSYILKVELSDGEHTGRGECEPHESEPLIMDEVEQIIEGLRRKIEQGLSRAQLNTLLPAGPARNAIDCALWDLEAKQSGQRAWQLAGLALDQPLETAYTIGLGSVESMAKKAAKYKDRALLKIKLNHENNLEILQAIRAQAPDSVLIVDANEAWTFEQLTELSEPFAALGVALIEQPLPAGKDQALADYRGSVPLCADESCLDRHSLSDVKQRYSFINIKLDKTGGLTEALLLANEAKALGLRIMVGCMTGTSLAMAPAMLIGAMAEFCDLDGPLLLAEDRNPGLVYQASNVHQPQPATWG